MTLTGHPLSSRNQGSCRQGVWPAQRSVLDATVGVVVRTACGATQHLLCVNVPVGWLAFASKFVDLW